MSAADVELIYDVANALWANWAHRAGWAYTMEREDAIQNAAMRCVAALPYYRADKGTSLRTYLMLCAHRYLTNEQSRLRAQCREAPTLSLDVRFPDGKNPRMALACPRAVRERELVEVGDEADHLFRVMAELPASDRHVIVERKAHERELEDIGRALGISRQAVKQREQKALARLTRALSRDKIKLP